MGQQCPNDLEYNNGSKTKRRFFNMKYFESVIGYEDIKLELSRMLDTIRFPEKYRNFL